VIDMQDSFSAVYCQPSEISDYHAKYFAHELTKRCAADSMEKLAGILVDA